MTAYQLKAPMPLYTLDAGCTVTVEAIDPNTGAAVTGVTVTRFAIYATNDTPADEPATEDVPLTWVSIADDPPA